MSEMPNLFGHFRTEVPSRRSLRGTKNRMKKQIYLRFSALGDKKKWRKKLQDLTSLCTFAPMKLQINYHTIYTVIKRITLLMLFFLCTLSCYSNDNLPQLEVKQRKGNMLIKLHNYNDTTSRLEKDTFKAAATILRLTLTQRRCSGSAVLCLTEVPQQYLSARKKPMRLLHGATPSSGWKMLHLTYQRLRCQE